MDYTCDNCENRYAAYCDNGMFRRKCSEFKLDEDTLSEEERKMLRAFRQVMEEQKVKMNIEWVLK